MQAGHLAGLAYAGLAALFFATAGPLARLAGGLAPGLAPAQIAFWRVLLASGLVLLISLATGKSVRVAAPGLAFLLCCGAVLGLHFYCYVASLFRTSLGHALLLVNTAPVWTALLSWATLKEPLPLARLPGILLCLAGMAWLVGFDPQAQGSGAAGDLMALAAAWLYALYAVSGRRGRGQFSLLTYAFWVYAGAAASLALLAPRTVLLGHVPRSAWGPIALLALLPTTVGHTLFNAAVRSAHAAQANLIATQEVSGGILLGWLLLGEAPSRATLLAWPVMLAGLAWVLVGRWPPGGPRPPEAGLTAAGRPGFDPQSGGPASERR